MPVPTQFGVTAANHGTAAAAFVTSSSYAPPGFGPQLITFAGAAAGQLAIVISTFTNAAAPSGWAMVSNFTWGASNFRQQVFAKVLSAGDVASGVSFSFGNSGGTFMALVFSGATACASVSAMEDTSVTVLVLPAFIKSANSLGLITYFGDRSAGLPSVPPTGWTSRIASFNSSLFGNGAASIASAAYPNGSTISWTGFNGLGEVVGEVLELT